MRQGERGDETRGVVTCAADGCNSQGLAVRELDPAGGGLVMGAPHGWGVIDAVRDNGDVLCLYVCSPSCERRLARRLTTPTLGSLG